MSIQVVSKNNHSVVFNPENITNEQGSSFNGRLWNNISYFVRNALPFTFGKALVSYLAIASTVSKVNQPIVSNALTAVTPSLISLSLLNFASSVQASSEVTGLIDEPSEGNIAETIAQKIVWRFIPLR